MMINDLYLLKLSPENASTKQKIISVLGMEWPLSAKQIYERVQKEYATTISYQGVHKIIKELEVAKVIERQKSGYQLNIDWIQKSKQALESLEKHYLQNKKIVLPENFSGSIEVEFDSFTDLCISTTELLLSKKLTSGNTNELIAVVEYGWWPLKFNFDHFKLLYAMAKSFPNPKGGVTKKTPFSKWVYNQYLKVGAKGPFGIDFGLNEDLIITGDYIIEVKFNEETKKLFEHYFNKWKNIEDVFKEFGLKAEPKIHAVMRISKNPEMAAFMKKQLEKKFEELK